MTYKAYKKLVLNALTQMNDGALTDDEASIYIKAVENLFHAGLQAQHLDTKVDLGPDPTVKSEPIDPEALVQEYLDLSEEENKEHLTACKEALFRRLGSKPGVVDVG